MKACSSIKSNSRAWMCRMRPQTIHRSWALSAILTGSLLIYLKMHFSVNGPCCQTTVQIDQRVQLLRFVIQLDGIVEFIS